MPARAVPYTNKGHNPTIPEQGEPSVSSGSNSFSQQPSDQPSSSSEVKRQAQSQTRQSPQQDRLIKDQSLAQASAYRELRGHGRRVPRGPRCSWPRL